MSKELEALEEMSEVKIKVHKTIKAPCEIEFSLKGELYDTIKSALQRLEAIENAKPSEALKNVNNILDNFGGEKVQIETMTLSKCNILTIKQALIKAQEQEKEIDRLENQCLDLISDNIRLKNKSQEQEKVLEIIKEYQVDIWLLKQCDYENYIRIRKEAMVSIGQIVNEDGIILEDEIPQEEFELLKRYLNE